MTWGRSCLIAFLRDDGRGTPPRLVRRQLVKDVPKARSTIGSAPDSKSGGWGFESLRACQV